MKSELIVDVQAAEVSIALLEDGRLVSLQKEARNIAYAVGDIYLAKVKKLMPGLNAAFVNVGYEKDAFLHYLDLGSHFSSYEKFVVDMVFIHSRASGGSEWRGILFALHLIHEHACGFERGDFVLGDDDCCVLGEKGAFSPDWSEKNAFLGLSFMRKSKNITIFAPSKPAGLWFCRCLRPWSSYGNGFDGLWRGRSGLSGCRLSRLAGGAVGGAYHK